MLNPNYDVRYDVFKPADRNSDFWHGYIYDVNTRKQKKWNLNVTSKREATKLVKNRIEEIYSNGDTVADHMRYHRELNVSTVLDRYMKDQYLPNRKTKKTPGKNNSLVQHSFR